MSLLYKALQGAHGYYLIDYKKTGKLLIYTTPHILTPLDFTGVGDVFADEMEIDLHVITDHELHISSNGKEGFRIQRTALNELGDFKQV